MVLRGRAHRFGDNVNTDYIIAGKYTKTLEPSELARHLFEDLVPGFPEKVRPGDFIVAGKNFGCGSSREQATVALKAAGISCVLAESFARIFYRNAINIGLPVLIVDTSAIEDGDYLEVDLQKGLVLKGIQRAVQLKAEPLPAIMLDILMEGGLLPYLTKYEAFIVRR